MFRSFIQATALILTLAGSYFLLKVNLGFSPGTIAKLSTPIYGYNQEIARSLAKQYAHTYIGFVLLIISFVLQIVYSLWPMTIDDLGGLNLGGILVSFIFCTIFLFFLNWYSKKLSQKYFEESLKILQKK